MTVQTAVTPGGSRAYVDVRPGELLPQDVPTVEVEALLRQGRIAAVQPKPEPEPVAQRPAKSAAKGEWVAYAVSQGLEQGEAEALKRDELVALFEDGGGE
ncbi:hypothetical protein HRW18_05450 [Streptomyces lunaelactis]|uniref:hypothetical protein n=1 Tax=Streptomyces lunaelactis TaxID=1535768 RepID=UPI0015846738|nr:hypothetical protein [Streptomyces lunaelactis]NUK07468.1 hypothetical protein [Streptomyces lunaelactis]